MTGFFISIGAILVMSGIGLSFVWREGTRLKRSREADPR
jgi:hypothetical protein